MKQTCCGQPMANSGYEHLTTGCDSNFITNFAEFDYIVSPSGSCTLHVKEHLHDEKNEQLATQIRTRIFELTEFITDVLKIEKIEGIGLYLVYNHLMSLGGSIRVESKINEGTTFILTFRNTNCTN